MIATNETDPPRKPLNKPPKLLTDKLAEETVATLEASMVSSIICVVP